MQNHMMDVLRDRGVAPSKHHLLAVVSCIEVWHGKYGYGFKEIDKERAVVSRVLLTHARAGTQLIMRHPRNSKISLKANDTLSYFCILPNSRQYAADDAGTNERIDSLTTKTNRYFVVNYRTVAIYVQYTYIYMVSPTAAVDSAAWHRYLLRRDLRDILPLTSLSRLSLAVVRLFELRYVVITSTGISLHTTYLNYLTYILTRIIHASPCLGIDASPI
ncbi:hypothetical protein CIB48_g7967 [Xylaria polymorpha]|nr:hypothetical protein CIB48_g7967 [Xylaria polymorpha]